MRKMSGSTKRGQINKQIFTNDRIGFEWEVTPNYFNINNCESDESDEVRYINLLVCILFMDYLKTLLMNRIVQISWLIVIR